MFRKLKQALTWDSDFDEAWRRHIDGLPSGKEHWSWSRRIAEKKAYWREQGKRNRITATEAVCTALSEIIDGIYSETCDRKDMRDTFVAFAGALHFALSLDTEGKPYVRPDDRLPERWRPFYEENKRRREAKKADLKSRAAEIQEHRFQREEINDAWKGLLSGDVPDEARRIWKASGSPRKSGHAIASAAGVSLKDFVFWMIVFRQHGWISEDVVVDEHLYANQEYFLKYHKSLGADMKRLLDHLSA